MLRTVLLSGLCTLAAAGAATAQNVAVGTCRPSLPSFSTIQAAIAASSSNGTVQVCPGTYGEQIIIQKNLTLKGISDGTSNAAVIVTPAGGMVANATSLSSGDPIATQVLVEAPATAVTITNLALDGSNNGITNCTPILIGILYQNASGTVMHTSVKNHVLASSPVDMRGCQSGLGIFVQSGGSGTSNVKITSNYVQNYQKNGITVDENGSTATITGNTVIGQGPTTGAAENSIQLGFGASGTIQNNATGNDVWAPDVFGDTGNAAAGILVYASPSIAITGNTVNNTQFGIGIVTDTNFGVADGTTVTGNKVSTTNLYDGIELCSNANLVQSNSISGSDEAGVHIDDGCTGSATGNTVTNNTINSACAGLLIGPGATGSLTTPNTYFNVVTLTKTGSNVCTPPLAASVRARRRAPSPARP